MQNWSHFFIFIFIFLGMHAHVHGDWAQGGEINHESVDKLYYRLSGR